MQAGLRRAQDGLQGGDIVRSVLEHPFTLGLAVGLFVALMVAARAWLARRALHKEIEALKQSLFTKMQIETKAHVAREDELERLRLHNENLRLTIGALQQKPGRAELRQLHIYDRAIRTMLGSTPGFAPAWEAVLRQAEEELASSERGITAFVRKTFSLQIAQRTSEKTDVASTRADADDE